MKDIKLLSGTVIVKPSLYNKAGATHDNNAERNIYLEVLAGKFPRNAQVVTGTVANFSGFGCGDGQGELKDESMMLMEFTQTKHIDKATGEQVTYVDRDGVTQGSINTNYTVLARLGALDYLNAKSAIGAKFIVDTQATKVEETVSEEQVSEEQVSEKQPEDATPPF